MNHKEILKRLKKREFAPVYFLFSEEPWFVDTITDYIEKNVLEEGEKSFNQVVLYGKDVDFKQVLDQAMQFPMMAPYRVVIVKEAQELNGIAGLTNYITNPSDQTILVLAFKHKMLDRRLKENKELWAAIKKSAVILESKPLYENQVPSYIQMLAADMGINLDQQAIMLLTEYLGNNLSRLSNEISKLALNVDKSKIVDATAIETYIGINKDYNIFELQKAIGKRDKAKAYRIVKHFAQNDKANPIFMNTGALYSYFTKLFIAKKYPHADKRTLTAKLKVSPFFVMEYKYAAQQYSVEQIKKAFEYLHDMDRKSKGVGTRQGDSFSLYQEFLYKLMAS